MTELYQISPKILAPVLTTFLLLGCTILPGDEIASTDAFEIVTIPSEFAHISQVIVAYIPSGLKISGGVHKNAHGTGTILGHVDVELISAEGSIIATGTTRYFRMSRQTRVSQFSVEIPVEVSEVSKIAVTHHPPHTDRPQH